MKSSPTILRRKPDLPPHFTDTIRILNKCRLPEVWPILWEFLHRQTGGRFTRLNEFMRAEMDAEDANQREAIIRVIRQAVETGDLSLLEPVPTFTPFPHTVRSGA